MLDGAGANARKSLPESRAASQPPFCAELSWADGESWNVFGRRTTGYLPDCVVVTSCASIVSILRQTRRTAAAPAVLGRRVKSYLPVQSMTDMVGTL